MNQLYVHIFAAVESLNLVRLFGDPIDCSPTGSSAHAMIQARTLDRAAMSQCLPSWVLPPEPSGLPYREAVKQHEQEPGLTVSAELCAKGQRQLPGGEGGHPGHASLTQACR